MRLPRYVVYGAGDTGTAELKDKLFELKLGVEFCDIRQVPSGDPSFELRRSNLLMLLERGNTMVPIMFDSWTGEVYENFESAMAHLQTHQLPEAEPEPPPLPPLCLKRAC